MKKSKTHSLIVFFAIPQHFSINAEGKAADLTQKVPWGPVILIEPPRRLTDRPRSDGDGMKNDRPKENEKGKY